MRPWAEWTAKTALLAAGFAAAGGGLSGVALAGTGGSTPSGNASVNSNDQVNAPVSIPASVCGNAGALLGIASADCRGGATTTTGLPVAAGPSGPGSALSGAAGGNLPAGSGNRSAGSGNRPAGSGNRPAGSGNTATIPVSIPADICGNAAAVLGDSTAGCAGGASTANTNGRSAGTVFPGTLIPGTLMQGVVAPVTSALGSAGPLAGLQPVSGLTSLLGLTGQASPLVHALGLGGPGGTSALGPGSGSAINNAPNAGSGAGAGNATVPTLSQLAGLGALAGLADLPSLAGLANMPTLNGVTGGGIPMPGTALSAANAPGMSSDSFAALAVGALLAGASALKIAGGRARDRKAGIGVAI